MLFVVFKGSLLFGVWIKLEYLEVVNFLYFMGVLLLVVGFFVVEQFEYR